MRKLLVGGLILAVVGCGGPKPEVSNKEVSGTYGMYVEPGLGQADETSMIIMRSAAFIILKINEDGTYQGILNNPQRANNGALLDEGTYQIQGKAIQFKTNNPASSKDRKELPFTVLGTTRMEPTGPDKYRFTFDNGDRILVFRQEFVIPKEKPAPKK